MSALASPATPAAPAPGSGSASPGASTGGAAPLAHHPTRPIRFWFRGQVVSVSGLAPTTTVLAWLREHQRAVGTKEGCNEGDCGACTVLVGRLDESAEGVARLHWRAMNSCLLFLPALDGQALMAVEDLGGAHPVQRAMVAHHGSQCGFCTPGFVMSMTAIYLRHADARSADAAAPACPPRSVLADDLAGNLCRCTGYRPILDAAQAMFEAPFEAPGPAADPAPVIAALKALAAEPALHLAEGDGFHAPRSLAALAQLRLERPQARLLAGATDIALWSNKSMRRLGELIHIGAVAELQQIRHLPEDPARDGRSPPGPWLQIGAGATLQAAWAALAEAWPALAGMGRRFAARPVREAGTLGGNLANGSPIGDGAPVLMALGARLLLRRGELQRRVPLDAFYTGYQRSLLAEGEFIEAIELPLTEGPLLTPPLTPPVGAPPSALRVYKLSQRHDSDISALACGLWLGFEPDGRVRAARLAFGGMAATVKRASAAEAALIGQAWAEPALQAAQQALAQDFQPLTDLRASAGHRLRSARALLQRFWLETRLADPLPAEACSVWPATPYPR